MLIYRIAEHFSVVFGVAWVASAMGQICMYICILEVLGDWWMGERIKLQREKIAGEARSQDYRGRSPPSGKK